MSEQSTIPPITYKPIEGFPGYRVGDDGSVWSCWSRKVLGKGRGQSVMTERWEKLRQATHGFGYCMVSLCAGKKTTRLVHRLVLLAFVGPAPVGTNCCHNDGNPANNALYNLRWDTPTNNSRDRLIHGTHLHGETIGTAKITDDIVRRMRADYDSGLCLSRVAQKYGLTIDHAHKIVKRKSWKHLSDDSPATDDP